MAVDELAEGRVVSGSARRHELAVGAAVLHCHVVAAIALRVTPFAVVRALVYGVTWRRRRRRRRGNGASGPGPGLFFCGPTREERMEDVKHYLVNGAATSPAAREA